MRKSIYLSILGLLLSILSLSAQINTCRLYFDDKIPQVLFGAKEIKNELSKRGIETLENSIASFGAKSGSLSILISSSEKDNGNISKITGGTIPVLNSSQSYSLRTKKTVEGKLLAVLAGDANGAMYGSLDIAEAIKLGALDNIKNCDKTPFIENRGIKCISPLDLRTPT